jgi:hypothetical protein
MIECVCWPIHSHTKRRLVSKGGVYLPYVSLTVRVPGQVANQTRETARILGWELADYLRTLICLGVVFFYLSFASQDRQDAASKLLGGLELLKLSRSFSLHFSRRSYKFRSSGRKSTLATLSLPPAICETVTTYANKMKVSRNEAYSKCLQQGLLIYLKAQTTILQASQK